jgi:hypothetical protein
VAGTKKPSAVLRVPEARVVLLQPGDPGPVGEEHVEPAVVVEVEEGHAAEDRLDHRLVRRGAVVEHEADAGGALTILEPDRGRPLSGRPRRESETEDEP